MTDLLQARQSALYANVHVHDHAPRGAPEMPRPALESVGLARADYMPEHNWPLECGFLAEAHLDWGRRAGLKTSSTEG